MREALELDLALRPEARPVRCGADLREPLVPEAGDV
jgi:hypothetical protein